MKQIEVTIMGNSYLLGCPEGGEAALQEAVARVDKEMCAIRETGKIKARERIAVLAALNLAYVLAQRPTAAAAADDEGPGTVAAAANGSKAAKLARGGINLEQAAELDALIARLDRTLEQDGHLL